MGFDRRFLQGKRLLFLGLLTITFFVLYTLFPSSSFASWTPSLEIAGSRVRSGCTPQEWSDGRWVPRTPPTNKTSMTRPEDALEFVGFESCASSREFFWHLAADEEPKWDRYPGVASWKWQPSESCDARAFNAESLVKDMAEQGGWLLIGDSVTELQFFSISCLLYPHVRATPNYTENPYFDRAWPQNLYLAPESPLIETLKLPPGFNITSTPLVTFRRVDLLLSKEELVDLYNELHHPSPDFALFSDERFWSLSPKDYLEIFQKPLPEGNYGTLVISTAGHWTTTLFRGFRDESKGEDAGFGIDNMFPFFEAAMKKWADTIQDGLTSDRGTAGGRSRQVVVRAYLPGHEDCHNHRQPWTEWHPFQWKWYNWAWIGDFNKVFQDVLSSPSYPDIHYLAIDRPGLLRPDGHVAGDCLHIMTGAGVIEGWTHYIWHFVTRELPGRIR
ncbi:hypothetical protein QCA50_019516 [Cerrena zonata]|uniref:Uncharacterized protein n=1 Tax=Cerrena zonata TaxID=2478898 RepID=A0AAW0FEM7_9APHY